MKTLTAKERLFCVYYTESRNAREAAARTGFAMPQRAAVRLLEKDSVKSEIADMAKERAADLSEVCAGYRRLAFGSYADALKLLFADGKTVAEELERLDMFSVSEIKKKDGSIEIKFFDRLKALEHLEALGGKSFAADSALPFYEALEKSAEATEKSLR